jgi:hypothetical protein
VSFRCEKTGCDARLPDGTYLHGDSYFEKESGSLILRCQPVREPDYSPEPHYEIKTYDHWWERRGDGWQTMVLSLGQYRRTEKLLEYLK